MGVFEAAIAAMRGDLDRFDRVTEWIEDIAARVKEADIQAVLCAGSALSPAHFRDVEDEMLRDLAEAVELVEKARDLSVTVLSQIP